MSTDGKQLEALVAFVEQILLPKGFIVKVNKCVYNDDKVQIAEFDVEIRGVVGSTNFAWLIECRDRPGSGPAPGSWIEQLFGRRTRFGFNKVTAVSTTGFSQGAVEFATNAGIELREVKALSPAEFDGWLVRSEIHVIENLIDLNHALIIVCENQSDNQKNAAIDTISTASLKYPNLKYLKTGKVLSLSEAFCGAVIAVATLFDDLIPNGAGKNVQLCGQCTDDDPLFVETAVGPVQIQSILFEGELRVKETLAPLSATAEYRQAETGKSISHFAAYEPQEILGEKTSMEMHRITESGEMRLVFRKEQ